jgi:xanthine dehydrogenase YagR molybdenum-binding subunit
VEILNGAQDIGTGTRTLMAIVAAEELGLPVDRIAAFIGNTNDPVGPGSSGSTTAGSIAPAARQAAYLAGQELRGLAAKHLGCDVTDLLLRDGKVVHVKDEAKSLSFTDACRLIEGELITARGKRKSNYKDGIYRGGVAGVQFADVEVDCDFGIVRVKKMVAIQDGGLTINRLAAESQVFGGVIQGISYALFEERVMDRHLGHQVNADMEMFKIAGPMDMPEIEVVLWDVSNGGNNTSTAGTGEPTTVPTAAAIAGAVHNALGVRVKSLPLTPDKILAALATKEKGR